MTTLQPADDEPEHGEYRGGTGWVLVAQGVRFCVVVDVDPGFGAMLYHLYEAGLDFDDTRLPEPPDVGLWIGWAKCWTSRTYEGEHYMGFDLIGEWREVGARAVRQAIKHAARRPSRPKAAKA